MRLQQPPRCTGRTPLYLVSDVASEGPVAPFLRSQGCPRHPRALPSALTTLPPPSLQRVRCGLRQAGAPGEGAVLLSVSVSAYTDGNATAWARASLGASTASRPPLRPPVSPAFPARRRRGDEATRPPGRTLGRAVAESQGSRRPQGPARLLRRVSAGWVSVGGAGGRPQRPSARAAPSSALSCGLTGVQAPSTAAAFQQLGAAPLLRARRPHRPHPGFGSVFHRRSHLLSDPLNPSLFQTRAWLSAGSAWGPAARV